MASYNAVVGFVFRDMLIIEGLTVVRGQVSGASGQLVTMAKEGVGPIAFSLPNVLVEKRVRLLCKRAGISPERFELLRLQVESAQAAAPAPVLGKAAR